MTNATAVHAKNTEAFIEENPSEIVLTRRVRVRTTAGGFKWVDQDALLPQTGRMVMSANKGENVHRVLPEGKIVNVTATLVMVSSADVELGDVFPYDGSDWVVGQVSKVPSWRISCEVGHA